MKILSVESSAVAASAAITEDGKIIGEAFCNAKLTHSQTLLPMVESVLRETKTALADISCFAVSKGPGSFTGIRIGIAAIKGMADGIGKQCIPVSTLETIAQPFADTDALVCAVMDARCQQVYTASFKNGKRITADAAIKIQELKEQLQFENKVILVGDGAELCYNSLKDELDNLHLANMHCRYQRASSVGFIAEQMLNDGFKPINAAALLPEYLRLPQAERELNNLKKEI